MDKIRNITGKLYDAAGNVLVVPITFTPIKVDPSFVGNIFTVEPDSDGEYNFTIADGHYTARMPQNVIKKVEVKPYNNQTVSSLFVGERVTFSKSDVEWFKDLVAFCVTSKVIQSEDGTLYTLKVDNSGNLYTEVYK